MPEDTLETAENKKTKVKKMLPAIVLVSSFYYSSLLALGLLVGYLGCKIYYNLFVETGKVEKIYIDFGKWKVHFHHWIMGAIVLLIAWIIDWFYLPRFFVGIVGGVIAHDIYDFNDWYKVFLRNKPGNEVVEK